MYKEANFIAIGFTLPEPHFLVVPSRRKVQRDVGHWISHPPLRPTFRAFISLVPQPKSEACIEEYDGHRESRDELP